ncbi:MAG: DUF1330 domain-containing protein [Sphingomonadaceae bacterium]|uniref:DUF1330 domain-containing protein n=1 Tax=Thermaurantiacus sp. TaxID=2820283 RepID=UPI00298F1A0F|nr:DUF1330 domain-containing protein [Thermaurantiacus sp.]MCS6986013.1 DUF1330 domain-containing protein [Sphingomonadaceae bacterium]MDW8414771.1 DUF1330 domain-containing protein [Thermaurantiacus sp.]
MSGALAILTAAALVPPPAADGPPYDPDRCDGRPVLMVVDGRIQDAQRLRTYAEALRASGLYPELKAYYLNAPRPIAVFEGTPPPERSILIVRFPCLAHARAFWFSKTYQERIRPLRLNPSAGDFLVTVHPELPVPAYAHPPETRTSTGTADP